MVETIEGYGVGSGKSYFVVTRLIDHFIAGGTAYVADSMVLNWDVLKAYVEKYRGFRLVDGQYRIVDRAHMAEIHLHTAGGTADAPVVIVLDEAQKSLNARDTKDNKKRALFDWAAESRHDDNHVWVVSQHSHNVDVMVRRIATFNWRVRNSENLGDGSVLKQLLKLRGMITFGLMSGKNFIVSQMDQDGKTVMGDKKIIEQDKHIFACYESKAMRGTHQRVGPTIERVNVERVNAAKGNPMIKYAIIGVVLAILFGVYKIKTLSSREKTAKPKTESVVRSRQEVTATPVATPVAAYDIRKERMFTMMDDVVVTDQGEYRVGELSGHGMVISIRENIVKIEQANGRPLFITAQRVRPNHAVAGPVPTAAQSPK